MGTTKSKKSYYICEKCGDEIVPGKEVWLELSQTDGRYYEELPEGHISQGGFCFGKTCAKIELKENEKSKN